MTFFRTILSAVAALALASLPAMAQRGPDLPPVKEAVHIVKDFKFHTGEVLPEVKLAYKTMGDPANPAILVLHGTAGSSQSMLTPGFGGAMFGEGQPFDARKYFIILPDAIGAGKSSKPSDGLKAKFPKYNYDDMVDGQHRIVTEALGLKHLRLIIGNSMGGMHTWVWGTRYPDMMDALVPMASQPTQMSSRNWMTRRLLIETIKADPDYQDGNYTTQPKLAKLAGLVFGISTNGGDLAMLKKAPTRAAADAIVDKGLAAPFNADANDYLYQWASSGDYNPEPNLGKIKARVLVVNSADDERNPPQTGLLDAAMKKVADGKVFLIPASPDTAGHGTTGGMAKLYAEEVRKLLAEAPKR